MLLLPTHPTPAEAAYLATLVPPPRRPCFCTDAQLYLEGCVCGAEQPASVGRPLDEEAA